MSRPVLKERNQMFEYEGRKHELSAFTFRDRKEYTFVSVKSGVHIDMSNLIDNKKVGRHIECCLRRFVYNKLVELGYEDTDNYIVILKYPKFIQTVKKSFVEIDVQIPNIYNEHLLGNKDFFIDVIDEMYEQIKKFEYKEEC